MSKINIEKAVLSEDEIQAWKDKGFSVRRLAVEYDGNIESFIMRNPTRRETYAFLDTEKKKGLEAMNDLIVNTCVLSGNSKVLKESDGVLADVLEIVMDLKELAEQKKIQSKKVEDL